MFHKIAIFGLNGSGKSTLAHALSKATGYFDMDAEDYYFPDQQQSRHRALECPLPENAEPSGPLPFSQPRTKAEVESDILRDIALHPEFILSSVTMNWRREILSQIDIAFQLHAPLEERLKRIQSRDERRFGARVHPGGDMYDQQMSFRKMAANRDPRSVEKSAAKLTCPIVSIDGMLPLDEKLKMILSIIGK